MLSDQSHPNWLAFLARGRAWTEDLYILASVPMWWMIAHLFMRFVETFEAWPWYIGHIARTDALAPAKPALADKFHGQKRRCDLDAFSLWVCDVLPTDADICSELGIFLLTKLFKNIPLSNRRSEHRFARQTASMRSSQGNAPCPATRVCNHMLSESKMVLDSHKKMQDKRCAVAPTRAPQVVLHSAWGCYLARYRCEASMEVLGERWGALSAEERRRYEPQPIEEVVADAVEVERFKPWPFTCDNDYPLSEVALEHLHTQVNLLSGAWKRRIGPDVLQPSTGIEPEIKKTCAEVWGWGHCVEDIPEIEQNFLKWAKNRTFAWHSMNKMNPTANKEICARLSLFFIGCSDGAAVGAAEDIRGHALLLLHTDGIKRTQVFFTGRCATPQLGDMISFSEMHFKWIKNENEVARIWYNNTLRFGTNSTSTTRKSEADWMRTEWKP